MAVVGIQEVLKHYSDIKKVYYKILDEARVRKPKVALLLDYPEFNLRLAKDLKSLGIPVVYYISPQVWAWRTGRVHQIKRDVDEMLVLFPFEKDFYQKHGVKVEFVGHPALDEIDPEWLTETYQKRQRENLQQHDESRNRLCLTETKVERCRRSAKGFFVLFRLAGRKRLDET
jgi:lipid-A-disaccharide synthase